MSKNLDTELLSICKLGGLPQFQKLVDDGANPNCCGNIEVTPLMIALEFNHSDIVSWLVSKVTVDVDRQNRNGNTALHYACRYSSDGVIVAKIAARMKDENVNLINREGKTALFRAVEWSNVSAIQGLLSVKSVDWEVKDKNGKSLQDMAR